MARIQASIEIDKNSWDAADAMLAKILAGARGPTVDKGLRKIGNQIKSQTKSILPKPGYPGDKPGMKPLRETLKVKVVNYRGGEIKVMVVGYTYSRTPGQGGNHGHLLEGGHDIVVGGPKKKGGQVVGHVQPYEYMIRVVEENKASHQVNFVATIQKAVSV
jgi:hypothetical protein